MKSKRYQVFKITTLYDPKTERFHNELQGNEGLSCNDFVEIMALMAAEVQKSKCKTMGEFFKSQQNENSR